MTPNIESFEVRDLRGVDFCRVDDRYLNGYARLCGIYATGVYLVLCRHANSKTQSCFPSESLIAKKLNVSNVQVKRAIKTLESHNIIRVDRASGRVNTYFLLDKRLWTTSIPQIPVSDRDQTSISQILPPVSDRDTKVIKSEEMKEGFASDSVEIGLSSFFLNLINERYADFKQPNLQSWAKHVNYMLRLDKREEKAIAEVMEWAQSDPFWQNNILSTEKLRKQYDRLRMVMETEDKKNGR
jgi:hypothetical protein